ncbi:unnamed protein product [Mytilus edulis]|uniref:Endonuclease/exonuclease/phosphatase domain-containing protein n=1 Tax=Mytilus edulis TaxID=6550 RepID=A0A8S3PQI7_MYTED|nr:unnamed protein product [Mytilus edulis]
MEKTIDHKITKVDCTNNRIQCIEITNTCGKDILVICVYMPCKDNRVEKLIEFLDCTEQLHSLCSQYNNTHHIVIGGDINENIIDKSESKRYEAVRALMDDHCLHTKDLSQASKRCKEAFGKWKGNERPTSPNNKIYCDMKFAKYELRKTCRIEIAMKVLNDRQEILDARTKHDQIFYKLLGKKK